MISTAPQYITDAAGNKISVVLPLKDYEQLLEDMEALEDAEDVRLYDEAKKDDTGEYVLLSDYVKNRKKNG